MTAEWRQQRLYEQNAEVTGIKQIVHSQIQWIFIQKWKTNFVYFHFNQHLNTM